ncbi:MAG: MFS transporter [Actinomycetota bacterium]
MSLITREHVVDAAGLQALRSPRTDVVTERTDDADAFEAEVGPFDRYRRTLDVAPDGPDRYRVTESTDFRLAIPLWRPLLTPLMRRALAEDDRRPRSRWWWPAEVVPETTSRLVSAICVISVLAGYLGVIIGQTITFAAEDFGNDDGDQANTLAAVRIGVVLSLVFVRWADRFGRRRVTLAFAFTAIGFTVLGSLASSLLTLGAAQTVSRGLTTGLFTLIILAATEEVPAAARAFTISLITVCAALGAGMVIWVLPVADVGPGWWRVVYLVPVLFVPVVWWVGRHLPETRRYIAADAREAPAPIDLRRLTLLGFAAFATALFASPASQLRNEFLRDELDFSASAISLFQLVISAPAGIAIVIAGIAADRVGRRWIGSIAIGVGAILTALSFQIGDAGLWIAASAGVVLGGASVPAMRGYQTELFPTRARAKVGGMLDTIAVAGSAVGLVTVGYLSERWGDLGDAITSLLFAPLLVAVVIILFFPETARRELEEFNPADPALDTGPSDTPTTTPTMGADDDDRPPFTATRPAGSAEPR